MKTRLLSLVSSAVLLASALGTQAQPTVPNLPLMGHSASTAYQGPRFPGGPDSLQAALRRIVRAAGPAQTGPLCARVELTEAGRPSSITFLPPPANAPALSRAEAQAVAARLEQLPAWVVTPAADQADWPHNSIVLSLNFGPPAAAPALPYSDELPTFPLPANKGHNPFDINLLSALQRQMRYPVADIRKGTQGTVYAYFEVSKTGAVEQRRIVGSVSPTLDAEVLRVVQLMPNALTPPRQQGQPVRVAYVLPFKFQTVGLRH